MKVHSSAVVFVIGVPVANMIFLPPVWSNMALDLIYKLAALLLLLVSIPFTPLAMVVS